MGGIKFNYALLQKFDTALRPVSYCCKHRLDVHCAAQAQGGRGTSVATQEGSGGFIPPLAKSLKKFNHKYKRLRLFWTPPIRAVAERAGQFNFHK